MKLTRTPAALIGATALLATAGCGPSAKLSLDLATQSVTVPRIVSPAAALLAPSAPAPVALPPRPPAVSQLPPIPSGPPTAAPRPPVNPCPKASPNAAPAQTLGYVVSAPPAPGTFTERSSGNFASSTALGILTNPVLTTVTALPTQTSTTGQEVRGWEVQQVDTMTKARQVAQFDIVESSPAPGSTAAGVYLVGLAWDDPVRGKLSFQPAGNGIEVLPSPVSRSSSSAQYEGIATDPNTLTTLELVGNVTGQKRIDLCGNLVDTWTDSLSGTLTSQTAQWNVTWTLQWATAYGAAAVQETLALAAVSGSPTWSRTLTSTTVPKAAS